MAIPIAKATRIKRVISLILLNTLPSQLLNLPQILLYRIHHTCKVPLTGNFQPNEILLGHEKGFFEGDLFGVGHVNVT